MRHWSPWDEQLLRALRGEFGPHSPALAFQRGVVGGVAVLHNGTQIGLWIATAPHQFRYLADGCGEAPAEPCDIMDIIDVHYDLFSTILDTASRDSA